ncbi:hypothetical protein [Pseudoxanthomonas suwonensis]|jgi:hypothetical protein
MLHVIRLVERRSGRHGPRVDLALAVLSALALGAGTLLLRH